MSRPIASIPARPANLASCVACAARKSDEPRVRRLGANLGRDRRDRRDAPAFEFGRRQHARPGIEDLRRIRARRELTAKIFGRSVDQPVDQAREQLRMAIGEKPRRRLVRRAAPGDHVARHCPRRAAETDQRCFLRQRALDPIESLEHRREPAPVGLVAKLRKRRQRRRSGRGAGRRRLRRRRAGRARRGGRGCRRTGSPRRSRSGGSAAASPRPPARVIAEIEKRRRLRPKLAIFGQVAARLAHEPDRRRFLPLASKRGEEGLGQARFRRRNAPYSAARFISG